MKLNKEEKKDIYKRIIVIFSGILLVYLVFNFNTCMDFVYKMLGYLRPIIIGFVIAFVANMIMDQFQKLFINVFKMKNKKIIKSLSLILSFLVIAIIVVFFLSVVVPEFIRSVLNLLNQLPSLIQAAIEKLSKYSWTHKLVENIEKYINSLQVNGLINKGLEIIRSQSGVFLTGTVNIISQLMSSFFEIFISLAISIYILTGKETLSKNSKKILYAVFPENIGDKINYVSSLLYRNFYNFFTGQFLEAILMGFIVFIGINIIGAPYAIMLAVTSAMLNIIPYFGAVIGAFLSVIIIALNSPIKGLIYLVYILVAQQIDGNYIYPKLVGSKMGIPSFWIIISITLGGAMAGIFGMLTFVPLVSTAYILLRDFSAKRLKEKNINIDEK